MGHVTEEVLKAVGKKLKMYFVVGVLALAVTASLACRRSRTHANSNTSARVDLGADGDTCFDPNGLAYVPTALLQRQLSHPRQRLS